jgi:hypothetical protein
MTPPQVRVIAPSSCTKLKEDLLTPFSADAAIAAQSEAVVAIAAANSDAAQSLLALQSSMASLNKPSHTVSAASLLPTDAAASSIEQPPLV